MTTETRRPARSGSDSRVRSVRSRGRVWRILRFDGHRPGPVLDSAAGGSIVASHSSHPMDSENLRTRCVILVSPGETPPQPLIDLLRNRSHPPGGLIRAEHPLLALARLAGLERDRRIRAETLEGEWPPVAPEKSILVVVNRDAWRDLNPLFGTIRELMPAVGIWVCTERIAIEIYAGDAGREEGPTADELLQALDDPHRDDPHREARDFEALADSEEILNGPSEGNAAPQDQLTEAELRDLLAHFEGLDGDLGGDAGGDPEGDHPYPGLGGPSPS